MALRGGGAGSGGGQSGADGGGGIDAGKVAIAQRLRRERTVTLASIAERLQMGTKMHLAHLLYWHERGRKKRHDTIDTLTSYLSRQVMRALFKS